MNTPAKSAHPGRVALAARTKVANLHITSIPRGRFVDSQRHLYFHDFASRDPQALTPGGPHLPTLAASVIVRLPHSDSSGESHNCQDFCSGSCRAKRVSSTSLQNKQRISMWGPKPCIKCCRTTPGCRNKCKSSKPSSTKATRLPTPSSPS